MIKEKQKLLTPSKEFRNKRTRKKVRQLIIDISFGLINTVSEFVLLFLIFNEELIGAGGLHGKFIFNLNKRLMNHYPQVNSKQWFEGIRNLRKKNWVDGSGVISKEGKERLQTFIPRFYTQKHWDDSWYLVSFDIPEQLSRKRKILRSKLKSLGFGMLQKSIWISPINFLGIVQKEVESLDISSYVLCSETKNLGIEDSKMLTNRIWRLNNLNGKYEEFILKYEKGISKDKFFSVFMEFMQILQYDPQLPVELLPNNWAGEEAYKLLCDFYVSRKIKNRFIENFFKIKI